MSRIGNLTRSILTVAICHDLRPETVRETAAGGGRREVLYVRGGKLNLTENARNKYGHSQIKTLPIRL